MDESNFVVHFRFFVASKNDFNSVPFSETAQTSEKKKNVSWNCQKKTLYVKQITTASTESTVILSEAESETV